MLLTDESRGAFVITGYFIEVEESCHNVRSGQEE